MSYNEMIKQGIDAAAESFSVMTPQKMDEFTEMTKQPGFERTEAAIPSWKSALGMGGRAKTFVQTLPEEASHVLNKAKTYVDLPRGQQGISRPAAKEGINTSGKSWDEITEEARLGLSRQGPKEQVWESVSGQPSAASVTAPVEKTLWNTAGKTTAGLAAAAAPLAINTDAFNGRPEEFNIYGKPGNLNGDSDLEYRDRWKNPLSPEPVPGMNKGLFEPPYAGEFKPTLASPPAFTPPAASGGGNGGSATPAEELPPSWATRNGWNISNEGKKNARGIGITPMGEQPTAVRISTKDRTGKGMMASAKLETDTKDTTLVANPNYNKGIVEDNGYAHVDKRKYIEKENWGKGEKVPLLQAMGFGKREEPQGLERAIKNIENDPNMRANGGLRDAGHKIIADLYGHQETAKLHKDNMEDRLAVMREANEQRGQQNKWAHEDRVQKQELAEAQSFLDLNKAYDFNPETGKEDKINNWLTTAKMLEATNGDVKKIPKVFRDQAANFQNRFETYFNSGTLPPGADKEKARRLAWTLYKEKYAPKKAE